MELFLETSAQRARRLAAARGNAGAEQGPFSGLWSGPVQTPSVSAGVPGAEEGSASGRRVLKGGADRDRSQGDAAGRSTAACSAGGGMTAGGLAGEGIRQDGHGGRKGLVKGLSKVFAKRRGARVRPREEYSIQQESYRAEIAYDKRRARKRKIAAVARSIAMVVLVPLLLLLLFVASYSLTCVLNGATPSEVVELLQMMLERVLAFAERLR